ncbi:Kelch repeat-containing protein [Parvularcula oceani]|uniref:Kelch repeat-containing protein n=1 Tax=Parvularcula oceani TaxID=1247963 RepID=UPI0006906899|nr:hypothetical protein [Parvularcula oceani]
MTTTRRSLLKIGALAPLAAALPAAHGRTPLPAAPQWMSRAPLPLRIQEIYAAAHDGEIWVAGGLSPDIAGDPIGVSDRVFAYDPAGDRWREGPRLPRPAHHPNLVSHEDRLYAVGGFVREGGGMWHMTEDMLALDGDRWIPVAPMPQPQAETVCASLGERLHVVTGRRPIGAANAQWSDHFDVNAHLAYDARADRWEAASPAPTARNSAAGAARGGRLFVVGGRTVTGGNSAAFEAYDAASDRWQVLEDMPEGRGGLAAAITADSLFVFGGEWFGENGGGVYEDVLRFGFGEQRWWRAGKMATPRHGLGAAAVGGAIHLIGGARRPSGEQTSDANERFAL